MLEDSSDEDPTRIKRRTGGKFEQRIAGDDQQALKAEVTTVIKKTISWPSTSQSIKGLVTAGVGSSYRYLKEKSQKNREGKGPKDDVKAGEKAKSS